MMAGRWRTGCGLAFVGVIAAMSRRAQATQGSLLMIVKPKLVSAF
jgi:hypothetical protein